MGKAKEAGTFEVYRNPDERCLYPFDNCGVGYCWSFAHHVDGTKGYEDMMQRCPGCEFWLPEAQRRGVIEYAYGGWHDSIGAFRTERMSVYLANEDWEFQAQQPKEQND